MPATLRSKAIVGNAGKLGADQHKTISWIYAIGQGEAVIACDVASIVYPKEVGPYGPRIVNLDRCAAVEYETVDGSRLIGVSPDYLATVVDPSGCPRGNKRGELAALAAYEVTICVIVCPKSEYLAIVGDGPGSRVGSARVVKGREGEFPGVVNETVVVGSIVVIPRPPFRRC